MQTFNFQFNVQEANTILEALQAMPYVKVAPLIEKLMQQANAQEQEGKKQQEAPRTQDLKVVKK